MIGIVTVENTLSDSLIDFLLSFIKKNNDLDQIAISLATCANSSTLLALWTTFISVNSPFLILNKNLNTEIFFH